MAARVLVAAEAPMVVNILAHKLRREGHEVVCARGATELADALGDAAIDCAVCEIQLFVADRPRWRSWLAIVDGRDAAAALHAMRLGAAGVVRTPFKPTDVAAQVATLLDITRVMA